MLRGYLIRLTREYTDGGMDSHAGKENRCHPMKNGGYCYQHYQMLFSANVRSAVHVSMGEAGVTFALSFAAFAKKYFMLSLTPMGCSPTLQEARGYRKLITVPRVLSSTVTNPSTSEILNEETGTV